MAFTWKPLFQERPSDANPGSLYVPTAGTYGNVGNMTIANVSGAGTNFSLFIDADGTDTEKANALFYNESLASNSNIILNDLMGWDENGSLGRTAGIANTVTFTGSGIEANAADLHPKTYKVLEQKRPPVAHGVIKLYQPAAGTIAVVKSIFICNTEGTNDTFRVYHDIDGTTYSQSSAIFYDEFILKNHTIFKPLNIIMNSSGAMACSSAAGSQLTFTIFGFEMPA